jgi:type II secretion system protein J
MRGTQKGMSLIEIMIAMVILSIIIYSTVSIVNQNQKIKADIDEETALYHEVRAAISMIERDVAQLFILEPRFSLKDRQAIHDAIFTGEGNKITGVTMNYQKKVAGQRDTHIKEIEYFLVEEKTDRAGEIALTLFKKMTSFLDADLFGPGLTYAVLTDIKSWKFIYYDEQTQNWIDSWDSRQGATQKRLPKAVAVSFEMYQRNPDNADAEPKIVDFSTKFLADAWIEKSRIFETSKSVGDIKNRAKKLKKGAL